MKSQRVTRMSNRIFPFLVWLIAVASVVALLTYRNQELVEPGLAIGRIQEVSAIQTGRLTNVAVRMFESVKEGDTIAVLKTNTSAQDEFSRAMLKSQRATAEAELEQLRAELKSKEQEIMQAILDRKDEQGQIERRLAIDLERARLDVLVLKTQLEPDKIMLADLELELNVTKELLESDAVEPYELKKIAMQYNVLAEKIEQAEKQLTQAKENLKFSQLRKDEFEQTRPFNAKLEIALDPLRKAILSQERRIEELLLARDVVVLVAPFDGVISQIHCGDGQAVLQGEPIVTISKKVPDHIVAWVHQNVPQEKLIDRKIKIVKQDNPPKVFSSKIAKLGPTIEIIPQRLWKNPDVEEWGRPVIIPINSDMGFLPNEIIGVKGL